MTARAAAVGGAGVLALLAMIAADIAQGQGGLGARAAFDALVSQDGTTAHALVYEVRLPRAAAGVLAGGALAAAAVLLQAVTRNPLAEPGTLGLTAGGMLAVTLAAAYTTLAGGLATIAVAFAGVLVGALLIGALAVATGGSPIRLVLAGMAITLALAAATAALQLVRETETSGLFLWGAGTLLQTGWDAIRAGASIGGVALLAALLAGRALDVLVLGDDAARALGQRAGRTRAAAALVAVVLVAVAVGVAGPIAFAGLIGVAAARAGRPRNHVALLALAIPWGGAVLLAADVLARLVLGTDSETPAGVVCALIGAPLLVAEARRSRERSAAPEDRAAATARLRPRLALAAIALMPVVALASLSAGDLAVAPAELARAAFGHGPPLAEIALELRAPRLCVALLAGACLAASGVVLQGVVRNPLASPELVGITGGASVAALTLLLLVPSAPTSLLPFATFAGSAVALVVVVLLAGVRGSPARLALVGLAVTATGTALTTLMVLESQPSASVAIAWLAGSTYASSWSAFAELAIPALVLLPAALLATRRLDILALGDDAAGTLGLPVARTRVALLALGAALAAVAIATTGAIAFVGLVAPHAARLVAGGNHRRLLPVAIVLGMALLAAADAAGRTVFAPIEVPSGLVVALLGAPYLAWLLWRSRTAS